MANPHNFLKDKFLDVGMYANAMELYKVDLVELRDQLKIKVSVFNALSFPKFLVPTLAQFIGSGQQKK